MNTRTKLTITAAVGLLLVAGAVIAASVTKVYLEHGGAKLVVASGGEIEVQSSGTIDVESGGALKIAGTAIASSAAELNILDGVTATADQLNAVTGASLTGAATTSAADALAIAVTHRVVAKTTGADAEALTLANGVAGQRLTIYLVVDGGGDGTLTPTTKSGFATIVFADAGDFASLEYVNDTVGWILLGTGGVSAPPAITL